MDIVFLEYIMTKKFGKIAHFVDKEGNDIYSKILNDGDKIFYQELDKKELEEIKEELS